MIEARIECLCPSYRLSDLTVGGQPVVLREGQVMWVSEADARASQAVAHARKVGAISVEWRERCQVAKPKSPTPPWLNRNATKPRRALPAEAPPPPAPQPSVDTEEVARRAEAAAAEAARKEMHKGLEEIKALLVQAQHKVAPESITQEQLEAALRNVLPAQQHTISDGGVTVTTDEPVFIPKDIVKKDADAAISIESEASGGDSLDAAAEALKATKPKRRRSPRKKKAEETE